MNNPILQYNGQEGVELAIDLLINEFRIVMALAGRVILFLMVPLCNNC